MVGAGCNSESIHPVHKLLDYRNHNWRVLDQKTADRRELDKVAVLSIDKGLLLQVAGFEQYKNDIFATDDIKTEHKNAYWLNH